MLSGDMSRSMSSVKIKGQSIAQREELGKSIGDCDPTVGIHTRAAIFKCIQANVKVINQGQRSNL